MVTFLVNNSVSEILCSYFQCLVEESPPSPPDPIPRRGHLPYANNNTPFHCAAAGGCVWPKDYAFKDYTFESIVLKKGTLRRRNDTLRGRNDKVIGKNDRLPPPCRGEEGGCGPTD